MDMTNEMMNLDYDARLEAYGEELAKMSKEYDAIDYSVLDGSTAREQLLAVIDLLGDDGELKISNGDDGIEIELEVTSDIERLNGIAHSAEDGSDFSLMMALYHVERAVEYQTRVIALQAKYGLEIA